MIRLKLEINKRENIILRMYIDSGNKDNLLIRRVLMESREIKSDIARTYLVPMKYFLPLYNNLDKNFVKLHEESLTSFFEYSDEYDENFYYSWKATPKFMKEWRKTGCPRIYKISLNTDTKEFHKTVVFEKPDISCSI